MSTIGITGASGLLGWHTRCRLLATSDTRVLAPGREIFDDDDALERFVGSCDAVIHFAGLNRGEDHEIRQVNLRLADSLVSACRRGAWRPHLIFANSTHHTRDTAYGETKRDTAASFRRWTEGHNGTFTDLILPHVFGERGRPFCNSVVSTFCSQLARGEQPTVRDDAPLELLHAQQAAESILRALDRKSRGAVQTRVSGQPSSVWSLLERLRAMSATYEKNVMPSLAEQGDLELFNTFRSYLYPERYPVAYDRKADDRGALIEIVKNESGGQTFVSDSHPGVTRGNHFHVAKVERFSVVRGEVIVRIRRLFDTEVVAFAMSGSAPSFIDIPTLHTHNLTNIGATTLVMAFWSNEIFDPGRPDTVGEPV
jgi:UDP-2-acetamido-2,6-beta-L-arabino-hexul-4-ose reductase